MAAAAARRGHTAPPGEEKAGSHPVQEVEARSAGARPSQRRVVEMLLLTTAIVRLLLTTILALVSGVVVVVRPNRPSQRFQVATLDAWQSVLGAASTRGRAVRPLPARASTMLNQPMDCGDDSGKVSLAATRSHQHGGCPM